MKILIAYDGSETADAALTDLQRAGLPADAEAIVLSVAEQWMPTPRSFGMVDMHLKEDTARLGIEAAEQAQQACSRLSMLFKQWGLKAEAALGSPARVLLERADEWQPDLIVVGSHGHSALGRFVLGSVSHKVATAAHCSVRIARGCLEEPQTPIRLIVGVDGSPGAELAVAAIARRTWPADSEARVVTADFGVPKQVAGHPPGPLVQWLRDEREHIRAAAAAAVESLKQAGLEVSALLKDARPGPLLCHEAEQWGADCIFVGANQLGRIDRFLLGSVSATVAMRAPCSVEIVRA